MTSPFEVALDSVGRVEHFVPKSATAEQISPEDLGPRLDGGERVVINGIEYDLTEHGSLVHPEVEVIDSVRLGSGVRLDAGTTFRRASKNPDDPKHEIVIGDRSRIGGTRIKEGVIIGRHVLMLARAVGPQASIGDHSKIGQGTEIFAAEVGASVKIDRDSWIDSGVTIGDGAKLGYKTRVCDGVRIGHHARVGDFTGAGSRPVHQEGAFIRRGKVIAPYDSFV